MHLLMLASGFAGLSYQIVWTQRCALWLGHEAPAVLAVVTAFFGGLATGAFTLGRRVARSPRPVRWYAGCELLIALWSLLLVVAMQPVSGWVLRATGVHPTPIWQWIVAFLGAFVLFLPATAAMGATLPAMERLAAARAPTPDRAHAALAALYASNTAGAVIGVLAAAFWLIPALGLGRTAAIAIGSNVLCGVAAWLAFRKRGDLALPVSVPAPPSAAIARTLSVPLALTGFLGIGYEVLVVRVLGQVTEDTVFTFSLMLAVYLAGTVAGATAYRRRRRARGGAPEDDVLLTDRLLGGLATLCLGGAATLWGADHVRAFMLRALGGGYAAALAAEAILAIIAFGPATILMGALFSHLSGRARDAGVPFGRALGVNTLGAAAAPLAWGVLAIPSLGTKLALLLLGLGYLPLTARRSWTKPLVWLPAVAAVALAVFAPPLTFVEIPAGGRVIDYREGVMAAVSVVEDAGGVARLRIDNRQQEGSSATFYVDARQAWLPLLLHPAARHALFLGLGTGVTAGAAAEDPQLEVDAVELLPDVIASSAIFRRKVFDSTDASPARLHLIASDARRYVRASDRRYDLIVSDNFHPARSGSGALYTVEHFETVRQRLVPGGLFCQWLPLHQLDLETLRSIVQSFLSAYPQATAVLASNSLETPVLGLIGRPDGSRFDPTAIRARLSRQPLPARAARLGLDTDLAVLGSLVAGPDALRRFAGDAAANTDDRPIVMYRAPRITYAPDSLPRDRLLALLRALTLEPSQVVLPTTDPAWPHRLAAYWQARDRFIQLGRNVRPSPRAADMLAQVRAPLLSVLRISPDFRPAYDPLLAMATALSQDDAPAARALLDELTSLQPARADAPGP